MSIKNATTPKKVEVAVAVVAPLSGKTATPAAAATAEPATTQEEPDDEDEEGLDDDSEPTFATDGDVEEEDEESDDAPKKVKVKEDSLDVEEDEEGAVVQVAKVECLQCYHLVSILKPTNKIPPCHFSRKGQDDCPAKSVKIVKFVNVSKIVDAFMRAERVGNHAASAKLYAQLATKSEWEQKRITDALHEARTR